MSHIFAVSDYLSNVVFLLQTTYNTGSPGLDRFNTSTFDASVCTAASMTSDVNNYQTSFSDTPMTSFSNSIDFGGDTPVESQFSCFEGLHAAIGLSDAPSFTPLETQYSIQGTYFFQRDAHPSAGGSSTAPTGGGGGDHSTQSSPTPPGPSPVHSQPQQPPTNLPFQSQFPSQPYHTDELSFMNQDYFPKPVGSQYEHAYPHGSGGHQMSPAAAYPPDNKEAVFQQAAGFHSNQPMFCDSRQGFQSYTPGYYGDSSRLAGPDSNFNFSGPGPQGSVYRGDFNIHIARPGYPTRPGLSLAIGGTLPTE